MSGTQKKIYKTAAKRAEAKQLNSHLDQNKTRGFSSV